MEIVSGIRAGVIDGDSECDLTAAEDVVEERGASRDLILETLNFRPVTTLVRFLQHIAELQVDLR